MRKLQDIHGVARAFVDQTDKDKPLRRHQSQWYEYRGERWHGLDADRSDKRVRDWMAKAGFEPTRANVANLEAHARTFALVDHDGPMPFWWSDDDDLPDPRDMVAFRNGLLDVRKFLADGDAALMAHTPEWFSAVCLPFDFDPAATCPNIDAWLREALVDQDQIELAEEWAGYCMSSDCTQQKYLLGIGPPRAGKGIYRTLLRGLVGADGFFEGSLQSMIGDFGLESLVGRQVAAASEIHLEGRDGKRIVQLLKAITGQDHVAVNRKNRPVLSLPLPVKVMLFANQLPRLPDDSGALTARTLLLKFPNSFVGNEDVRLGDRLLAELPGLANRALAGLRRLRERGGFLQPEAGKDRLQDFADMAAPIEEFLEDYCEEGADLWDRTDSLYGAWRTFCHQAGRHAEERNTFGSRLVAARPKVRNTLKRVGDLRLRAYRGVRLNEAGVQLLRQWDHEDVLKAREREFREANMTVEEPVTTPVTEAGLAQVSL